jgi:Tol biopolymer transport system component
VLLAFRGKPAGEQAGIFTANLASDAPVIPVLRLTTGAWDRQPVWSPDGRTLAFTSGSSADDSQIWTMSADGTGKHRLTGALRRQWDADPAWSPDGKKIVYASTAGTGKYGIAQVSLDGVAGPTITGGEGGNQRHPGYSPDGAWLVFSSDKDGNQEIYVAPADGSRWTNISLSRSADGQPNWGP